MKSTGGSNAIYHHGATRHSASRQQLEGPGRGDHSSRQHGNENASQGGAASAADGNATLVPLRGGCEGGDGADGWIGGSNGTGSGGGGAVQISARGTLTVAGTITAGGGGGEPGDGDEDSGGGSGGAILLESSSAANITGTLGQPEQRPVEDDFRVFVEPLLAKRGLDQSALAPPELAVAIQQPLAEQAS